MKRVWKFISQPQNLAVLIAIGGLLSFLFTHFLTPAPPASARPPAAGAAGAASATTGDHGVVIQNSTAGGDIRVGEKR